MDLYPVGQAFLYLGTGIVALVVLRVPLARLAAKARRFFTKARREIQHEYQDELERNDE